MKKIPILFLLAILFLSCSEYAEKEAFYISQGYKGTVAVIYDQRGGAPKEYTDNRRIYRIPENGVLYSELPIVKGVLDQKYYYVDLSGKPVQELPSLPLPILPDDKYEPQEIYVMAGFDGTLHEDVRFTYVCIGYVSESDSLIAGAYKLINHVNEIYPIQLK